MEQRSRKDLEQEQQSYIEALKNYKDMGVRITIDGEELPEQEWNCIFRVSETRADGANAFYMADIIAAPEGTISEIRLDKIFVKL